MINLTIKKSQFPDDAKKGVVVPLHKQNSCLDNENSHPVSILSILSKLYEKALNAQFTEYFDHHFDIFLSAFRVQYGCQSTLLMVIEDWKQALDQNEYVAAISMDLSKAFDCLPNDLPLLKLKTYGLSENAKKWRAIYLTNRKQCVKLGNFKSNFQLILKGVPQEPFWDQSFSTSSSMTPFISLKKESCIIMQMILRYHTLTQILRDSLMNLLKTALGLSSGLKTTR